MSFDSPEEVQAVLARGLKEPTLAAVIQFVGDMTAITVGEASGFWTAGTCNAKRDEATATFIVAMEKAVVPSEG